MNISVRPATIADSEQLAAIHIEGWRASYEGIVDPDFLAGLSVETRTQDWQRWFTDPTMQALLAYDQDGTACGFASYGKLRTPLPGMSPIRPLYSAEIYALYILPQVWRQGVGTRLMSEAAKNLRTQKHNSLCLWVIEKNARALAFYRARDGARCGKKDVEIGKSRLRDVCFGWRDSSVLIRD